MHISQVSKKYQISVRTIRYYESYGLIKTTRNESNVRQLDRNALDRLELILVLRHLQLSLTEIKAFMDTNNSEKLKMILMSRLAENNNQLNHLKHKQNMLRNLLTTFGSDDVTKHNVKTFVKEQMFFTNNEERKLPMIDHEKILLEIGVDLIPIAASEAERTLLTSIQDLRKEIEVETGEIIELVRIRDNVDDLEQSQYRVTLEGDMKVQKSLDVDHQTDDEMIEDITLTLKAELLKL